MAYYFQFYIIYLFLENRHIVLLTSRIPVPRKQVKSSTQDKLQSSLQTIN